MTVFVLLAGLSGAVVDENGSSPSNNADDGELAITSSGSTASSSTAVGPNGTKWTSSVKMDGRTSDIANGSVTEPVFSGSGDRSSLSFNGSIVSATPCHVLESEIEKVGQDSYVMNITTVKEDLDKVCKQQLVMIDYDAEFEHQRPYELKVLHDGEKIETFEAEDIAGPEPEPRERGFIGSLVDFFTGLF